ncbi:hypothetical protein J2Z66_005977 [Paenibacillus eucommiae]|uniref:Uncharacterized protein n=1 Tax=Paenibacillus eucommiae TaxID=1355755 RepID=A0ABS4J3B4_9BACL|nr:hypothetical protein [Paenibacillus eucommiae]
MTVEQKNQTRKVKLEQKSITLIIKNAFLLVEPLR